MSDRESNPLSHQGVVFLLGASVFAYEGGEIDIVSWGEHGGINLAAWGGLRHFGGEQGGESA